MAREEELSGGNMTPVSRIGQEVRRSTGPWTPAVHRLLRHLEHESFTAAPQVLGVDDQGRERLTYLPGTAAMYPLTDAARSDAVLRQVGDYLRKLHDATATLLPSAAALRWREPQLVRQPAEVICHNDVAPYNTVLEGQRVVGFIDFDFAAPGPRLWDVVHAAYRWVPLCADEQSARFGWSQPPDRALRLRELLGAYGVAPRPSEFARLVVARVAVLRDGHIGPGGLNDHLRAYEEDLAWMQVDLLDVVEQARE